MKRTASRFALPFLALVLAAPVQAQSAPTLVLDGTSSDGFVLVRGVRELANGEVLVADPLSQTLVRLNFDMGSADTLGRTGRGPREYIQPDLVLPLPGDSSLLVDLGNARLTAIGPDGSFGATMPMTQGDQSNRRGLVSVLPRFSDESGRLYFCPSLAAMSGAAPTAVAPVLRFNRRTKTIDTVQP